MKPLVVSLLPRPPHPTRDGGAIRNYHLLQGLLGQFRVVAVSLVPPDAAELPWAVPGGVVHHLIPLHAGVGRAFVTAMRAIGGEPFTVAKYRSAELVSVLRQLVADERPTWVVSHGYHLGRYAIAAGAPSWVDLHNIESVIWERLAGTMGGSRRLVAMWQAGSVARLERRLLAHASGVSVVSDIDRALARDRGATEDVCVVPNGVNLARYTPRGVTPDSDVIVFVGDLRWRPNADGVAWFAREIWPQLRLVSPFAQVEIVGRGAGPELLSLADDRFRFLGDIDDTRDAWARATVAIVPLRVGGGTRLKILEAAASGVPVISTSIGAEGLAFDGDHEIIVEDAPRAWTQSLSALLEDPERRTMMTRAARKRVESEYDWSTIGASFGTMLAAASRPRGATT